VSAGGQTQLKLYSLPLTRSFGHCYLGIYIYIYVGLYNSKAKGKVPLQVSIPLLKGVPQGIVCAPGIVLEIKAEEGGVRHR
jgi:hypothetical protein